MGYGIFNQYDVLINIEKSEKDAEIYLSEMINVGLATDEYTIVDLEEYFSVVDYTRKVNIWKSSVVN